MHSYAKFGPKKGYDEFSHRITAGTRKMSLRELMRSERPIGLINLAVFKPHRFAGFH